jgi:hypothetical protein
MKRSSERGGILVVTMIALMLAMSLAYAATSLATARKSAVSKEGRDLQARAAAEAGVHRAIAWAQEMVALDAANPFAAIDHVAGQLDVAGAPIAYTLADGELLASNGRSYAALTITVAAVANGASRDLRITASGHVPDATHPLATATAHAIVRLARRPAPAQENAYFVNHWAWLYSDKIAIQGNAGSNGQLDCGGHKPTVDGSPRYAGISLADPLHPDLQGYVDDNGDMVEDGSDGGLYSAWDIVGADKVQGMGGLSENQHAFGDRVTMPQITNLAPIEATAIAHGSSLAIGGGYDAFGVPLPPTVVADAVLGDGVGEQQNLVLIGTVDQPILLDGPVVVRGDVIIKGVVTGQGSIYASCNLYIADDVTYLNPPTSWTPASNSEADVEAWLAANTAADFCGLFARENVVIGDFTQPEWTAQVDAWLSDPANESSEDAGTDGIPNTIAGKDGKSGTADDDVLEGDGCWTVEHYTTTHADLGVIPAGKSVGDVIPGTGEDLDGDGVQDATVSVADFGLAAALDSGEWAGNLPGGTTCYDQIASIKMTTIESAVATEHAAAGVSLSNGTAFELRGGLVARIEAMLASTQKIQFTFDGRMTAGGLYPDLLPQVVVPPQILAWQWTEENLHHVLAAAAAGGAAP